MAALADTSPLGEALNSTNFDWTSFTPAQDATPAPSGALVDRAGRSFWGDLKLYFGTDFSVWDGETGRLLRRGQNQPTGDETLLAAMIPVVARHAGPQFVGDEDCTVLLAIPLRVKKRPTRVAVGAFVTRRAEATERMTSAALLLGMTPGQTRSWMDRQSAWPSDALLRLATAIIDKYSAERHAARVDREFDRISSSLVATYKEVSLLYDLVQQLRISRSETELSRIALGWLHQYLPAECVALQRTTTDAPEMGREQALPFFAAEGSCPLSREDFSRLVRHVQPTDAATPYIANRRITSRPDWPFPAVRELILTPVREGDTVLAWLVAFNHRAELDFGTAEANLVASVSLMLGIHSGNRELHRQQTQDLACVVRAMSSAIDAKDPCTCGHSERVARVAVRLAQELGWEGPRLSTVYFAGILHDIGKIGIDEGILKKPAGLTAEEYAHIRRHPLLGHKILAGIRQLNVVLPAVLYHHERWDGRGYPSGLKGESIPELARTIAVADSYDAMTSDRPYRDGMPVERVSHVFREGSGRHWDPRMIEAFFAAEEDIRQLGRQPRANWSRDLAFSFAAP